VEGNGNDEFGYFSVSGEYSATPPYSAKFVRSDFGSEGRNMEFSGFRESEGGGIFGTWRGTDGSGDFHFKPSKGNDEVETKIKEASRKSQTEQLTAMGFPDYLCNQALDHTNGDLSAAIEWITKQLSEGGGTPEIATPGVPEAPDEMVKQLTDMGFSSEQAKLALAQNDNDVARAIDWLFAA